MTRSTNTLLTVVLLAVTAAPALAQRGPNERKAASRFRQGQAYAEQKLYDKAIVEFKAAYELVPRALILFHVGRAHHQKGDLTEALDYYRRFVADQPDGKVAAEARRYVARIEKRIAEQEAAARASAAAQANRQRQAEEARSRAETERNRARAEGHVAQAKVYVDAGLPAKAITELEQAYDLVADVERLYDLGEAHRAAGDKQRAREYYLRYTTDAPTAPRADDARQWIGALTRDIELGEPSNEPAPSIEPAPSPSIGLDSPGDRAARSETAGTAHARSVSWVWVGVGAAAVVAGLASDLLPDNGSNGRLDATDFVPAGFYAMGAGLVFVGVF